MPVYLDCAATTPLEPRVRAEMLRYLDEEFGNAGSRTHDYGQRARAAVEQARDRVAAAVGASRGDVIFTSGATESNNLALLGLAAAASQRGPQAGSRPGVEGGPQVGSRPGVEDRRHIVSSEIEHHAVLEPLGELQRRGFEVTLVSPNAAGWVEPDAIRAALRPDTLAVSLIHVNNETGVIQPIVEAARLLEGRNVYLHVDAAQSFGRQHRELSDPRIDLISISAHKIHGPKGIGALIVRRREGVRPPLRPLMFGGGQERGLRPGTLPVPLIAAFGKAAELAVVEGRERRERCRELRRRLLDGLAPLRPVINGDPDRSVPEILNVSFPGVDAETAIDAWRDLVAISNGAACTSQAYTCSHVLSAMRLPTWRQEGALRFSWCASSALPDCSAMVAALAPLQASEPSSIRAAGSRA